MAFAKDYGPGVPGARKERSALMSELWTLLFRYSFGLLCHSVILYLMTNPKYSRRVTLGAWLGTFALITLAIIPLLLYTLDTGVLFVVEAFSSLAVYCGVYLCLSKGSVWRNLFIFFAYATFFLFSLILASCVSQMFFGGSHWATVAGRTFFLGLYTLWLMWKPFVSPQVFSGYLERSWISLAAFSVFSGLTVYITALTFMILKVDVGIRMVVSMVLFLLIGSAYLVAGHTITLLNQEHEAKETESQRKLLESQLATEREFVSQAKAHRHDLHHHINLLTDYLERGDVEGARAYLGEYKAGLNADRLEVFCENTVANALLRYTVRRCGDTVSFTCRTVIPVELSLTGPELATVLGNVLENAWEASCRSKAPWISVTARVNMRMLLVEVKNAVSGEIRFEEDLPVSAKPGGGLGLKSVSQVLERHGGLLHCCRTGDTFFTQIAIPL